MNDIIIYSSNKKLKLIFLFTFILTLSLEGLSQPQWEQTVITNNNGHNITDVSFVNPNIGFIAMQTGGTSIQIYKTITKGATFQSYWSGTNDQTNFSISFKHPDSGFVSFSNKIILLVNGVQDGATLINLPSNSGRHKIKYFGNGLGYALYSRKQSDGAPWSIIYKTTDGGNIWFSCYNQHIGGDYVELSDIDVSKTNFDNVTVTGFVRVQNIYKGLVIQSTNGFTSNTPDPIYVYNTLNLLHFDNINYLPNNDIRILSNDGIYNQNLAKIYDITPFYNYYVPQFGFKFCNNNLGIASLNDGRLIESTNGGYNWSTILTLSPSSGSSRSSIYSIGEIAFYGDARTNILYTRKLSTNLLTLFDNESNSCLLSFDGNSYNTPTTTYLRGGYSALSCSNTIDSGQINEKIFYKWSDGYMNRNNTSYYFDMSGTSISNYYKTKQLSATSSAISNPSQTKSVRDTTINNVTATHTIHESMGGIFYSKSSNFGATYQTEEVVNLSNTPGTSDESKNANLCIIRFSGSSIPLTAIDPNRNVAAVWEKYNSITGKVEIKLSRRELNSSQTSYEWKPFTDNNEVVTSFDAPSYFQSSPKCFMTAGP